MLARENKGNAAGKSDKAAMQEVHDMLKRHYQVGPAAKALLLACVFGLVHSANQSIGHCMLTC